MALSAMRFTGKTIFHPERPGDGFGMTTDLFDEVSNANNNWAVPFIGNNQAILAPMMEKLFGAPGPGEFNPFTTALPEGVNGVHVGPDRNTVNNIVIQIKKDPNLWKQFNEMDTATAHIRRGLCVVAKLPENFLTEPAVQGDASSSSTQSGSIRFSQRSVVVRVMVHDNKLLKVSEFSETQVHEINQVAVNALNKNQLQSYASGGNFTSIVHPRTMSEFRHMALGIINLVSTKLGATSGKDQAQWVDLLNMVNKVVDDTEHMLRLFKSHTCASALHTSSKTGASLLSKGTLGPFAHALHKWSIQQSSLGNLRIGPLKMQFVPSPVNFIHLVHLFHFVFEETSGPAVHKAKALLLHYSEVNKKRDRDTVPNSPNKIARGKEKRCYNCNKLGHVSANCPKDKEPRKCFKCGEIGHIASKCKKKPASDSA